MKIKPQVNQGRTVSKHGRKFTTRAVGRPKVTDRETGARYNVYLLPAQVAALQAIGEGSLSAGIATLLKAAAALV